MRFNLAVSIVLLTSLVAVAKEAATYRWSREIKLPAIEATTPAAVALDSHFFQSTRDNWPDVQLINAQGDRVAYLIRPSQELKSRTIRRFWIARQTSAKVHEDTGLQVELELDDKDPVPSGIRIVTPLRDFEHQIRIDSSTDGENWKSAGPAAMVFDYSRYVDARSDLVPFHKGTDRRFRITVLDPTAEQESQFLDLHRRLAGAKEIDRTELTTIARRPFRIDRIEFYRDEASPEKREPKTTVYAATDFTVTEDTKKQQAILSFSTKREPVTQIKIMTNAENFSRLAAVEAEVEGDNGRMAWRQVATGTLTQFAVGRIQKTDLTLTIPEQRSHHYRVLIENRDSPALAITGVETSGPIYEMTFLATRGQDLTIEYGSDDSVEGHYDTAALREALGQATSITSGALEGPQKNPNATSGQGRSWTPWNDSRVLVGVIIALTALFGWGLYQAGKRVTKSMPPDA